MSANRSIAAVLLLCVVLAAAWLSWSGHYSPLLLGCGVVSIVLVTWLSGRMGLLQYRSSSWSMLGRSPRFAVWLLKEIAISSARVTRVVLDPRTTRVSTILTVDSLSERSVGQATLGNSITLTPGTITLDVRRGKLLVHCLTAADAEDLRTGEMNRRVAALIGR